LSDEEQNTVVPAKRPGRRFGDEEVAAILERAANMQEHAVTVSEGSSGGLTLEDLRQIAEEAGIHPRFVDLASADLSAPVEKKENGLAGGAYSWQYRSTVDGEILDRDRDQILHAIRSVMGQKGELVDVYGRMEWSYDDGTGAVIIGISSHDGKTEIDVSAVKSAEAGMIHGLGIPFGGVFGGAAVGGLLGLSGGALVPVLVAAGGVSYAAARMGWKMRSKWWERRLEKVVERVSSIVQDVALLAPPGADEAQ
jgi:hypothetical protein